ncbi:MAG: methyl-accepting chemotaxis protein [Cellulosilyticum sp.]|nr:methyl-accepting chemotaxis protein [Cellulosilyticum sp.]
MKYIYFLTVYLAWSSVFVIIIGIFLAHLVGKIIARRVAALSDQLRFFEAGNFKEDFPSQLLAYDDEIGQAAKDMQILQGKMHEMIGHIKDTTVHMDLEVEQLNRVSEQMAQGVTEQTTDLVNVSQHAESFGNQIEEIVREIQGAYVQTEDLSQVLGKGQAENQTLITSVDTTSRVFSEFKDKFKDLSQKVMGVIEITNMINSIAEQTNLLALNASIEAARAGEAGKSII